MAGQVHPIQKIPTWKEEPALNRANACLFALFAWEFLTEAEHKKVKARILKWLAKHEVKVKK